jgi:hypothetical protein
MALTLLTMCLMAAPLSATAVSPPVSVAAYSTFSGCDAKADPQTANATACTDQNPSTDPISGSGGILLHATQIISYIAGAAAIILLILGGIRYITSGGDASNVKSAKDTVLYALIGIAIVVIAQTLIAFVLDKLS